MHISFDGLKSSAAENVPSDEGLVTAVMERLPVEEGQSIDVIGVPSFSSDTCPSAILPEGSLSVCNVKKFAKHRLSCKSREGY
ncbi:MAG: hypothetical protein ACKPKO_19785, partial [Candidatus Fonsibacter sp.]